MNTSIRPYHPSDFDAVLELLQQNTPKYFAVAEKADLEHYLLHEIEQYFVAEYKQTIVACGGINFFPENKEARISWDIVALAFQGRGVGTQLLLHRLQIIRSLPEYQTIIVRTTQLVFPFYQKHGFTLQETVADYWNEGLDLYCMQMENSAYKL